MPALPRVWFAICRYRGNVKRDKRQAEAASIPYLELLTDDELILLVDYHATYFRHWEETGEDPRVSLIYHGQILWALLDECERRGKTAVEMAADFNRKALAERAWTQAPGHA